MSEYSESHLAYIKLNLVKGLGSTVAWRLIRHLGCVTAVMRAGSAELLSVPGMTLDKLTALRDSQLDAKVEAEIQEAAKHDIRILTPNQQDYPSRLQFLYDPPVTLYVKGTLQNTSRVLAMVGTRMPSTSGRRAASDFAQALAASGVTVVSGLARGIDTLSHEGALKVGGQTWAVLGSGLLAIYPRDNASLAARIVKSGAIVSEFSLHTEAQPFHFPLRNRIVSGLSDGVLIVDAPHKSGALITADQALEQGRDVMVIPGNIHTKQASGGNNLLKQGALCVTEPEDVLRYMRWNDAKPREKQLEIMWGQLSEGSQALLSQLPVDRVISLDELCAAVHESPQDVVNELSELETKGWVSALPGQQWELKREAAVGAKQ